jgi:protein SCO1/2
LWSNRPACQNPSRKTRPEIDAVTRLFALLAAGAVVVGLVVGGLLAMRGGAEDAFADCRRGQVVGGTASIGGPFSLVDAAGARVTEAEAITGPTLVYFGYGFCPDICPTDLSRNSIAAGELADRGIDVGQVFITIDPDRDTPDTIGDFAQSIDPELVGLTGTPEEIAAAAAAYKVFYRKAGDDPTYYLMDHSTFTYLMAPEQGFLEFFASDVAPDAMADSVACFAERL